MTLKLTILNLNEVEHKHARVMLLHRSRDCGSVPTYTTDKDDGKVTDCGEDNDPSGVFPLPSN